MDSPRSVGQVNRNTGNSSLVSIVPKAVVMEHKAYEDSHPSPETKTMFAGCLVRETTDDEFAKMQADSTSSGYVSYQNTLTKKRNMETYEIITEHDASEDSDEEDLNIDWGDYESFKND